MLINALKEDLPSDIIGLKRTFTFLFELRLNHRSFGELDWEVIHSLDPWLNSKATENIKNEFQHRRMHWSMPWAPYVLSKWIQGNL